MSSPLSPRTPDTSAARTRLTPGVAAALVGGLFGLAIGVAYLGGTVAKATTLRAQAVRLDGAAAAGFTEEALSAAAGGLNASALAIARRHDPYTVAGPSRRDRQTELLTARLEQLRPTGPNMTPGLRLASTDPSHPAAQPFRLGSALDASRDLECLTQAVYYEARGEGRDGQRAVAQVVINRARHPAFPKTVCAVVFQGAGRRTGCQFSFTCDGSMRRGVNQRAWNRARQVASEALSGSVYAPVGNATHFHTTGVSPRWRTSLIRVGQVGDHVFYRFGGRSGSSRAFAYDPAPSTGSDEPRLVQAGLDMAEPVRQVGQAVAYSVLLAEEGRTEDDIRAAAAPVPTPTASTPPAPRAQRPAATPAPAAVPAAAPARRQATPVPATPVASES
ncbi:cell wall hydrolase [Brevundimonas sp.]|uniref:cell wall hydrolase n=1 Tax=Brevundimonas sp. TaxID=1871086 RepID=UPI003517C9B4